MVHDFDPAIVATPFGTIYWYGAVYTVGFIGFLVWFLWRRRALGLTVSDVCSYVIVVAIGIMVGGRILDIVVYEMDWYRAHPGQIVNWWVGGMASHGVMLGTLLATLGYAWIKRIPVLVLLDEIVVPGAFLMAVGRLGNFIEGGVIGSVTDMPWGVVYADLEGARHPVALYDGLKNLLLVPVLMWALRRWPAGNGIVFGLFVLLYSALRFLVELFRDYESVWLGVGPGQILNLLLALGGAAFLILVSRYPQPPYHPQRPDKKGAGWLQAVLLMVLILYPLGIPTSWTAANIAEIRQSTQETLPPDE